MSALPVQKLWTAEDYLAWERKQDFKHELIDNLIVSMSGASRAHNLVSSNIMASLHSQFRGKPCEVYPGDMQVQVEQDATYTYPDVVVVCGEPQFRDDSKPETLLNPTILFEVLSPSTEWVDRNRKLFQYRRLESLAGYYIVSQDSPRVEAHTRQGAAWAYADIRGLDARLRLDAIGCELALHEIYERLDFAAQNK